MQDPSLLQMAWEEVLASGTESIMLGALALVRAFLGHLLPLPHFHSKVNYSLVTSVDCSLRISVFFCSL